MDAKKTDHYWMKMALDEARKSVRRGEVPVGVVAVLDDKRLSAAHNRTISDNDPTAHAEMVCLRRAAARLRNYRLNDIIVYVTKEPCAMCAGAFVWARIRKVVFGCWDRKAGACGSVIDLSKVRRFNHRFDVAGGVLNEECQKLIQSFFKKRRKRRASATR